MTDQTTTAHVRPGLFREDGRTARLLASKCADCGSLGFPARAVCAKCSSFNEPDLVELSDHGTLYTFAIVRQAPKQFPVPYVIGYVDTDDGVRVFTQVTVSDPSTLRLGSRMRSITSVMNDPTKADAGPRLTYTFEPVNED